MICIVWLGKILDVAVQSCVRVHFRLDFLLFILGQCILNDANYGPLAENVKQYPPAPADW